METAAYIDAITREASAMAAAVDAARHRPVAACPGWDVADLAVHMGHVYRWCEEIVRTRATTRPTQRWTCAVDDPGLGQWLLEGAASVSATLSDTDPDTAVWTMGPPPTARFWSRRQAVESLVHRWDMETAAGGTPQMDAELATEGVGEMLEMFLPRVRRRSGVVGSGETIHLHRTDGPGEWFVRFAPEEVEVTAEHAKADVALRGPAADLLLVLWRRLPPDTVQLFGDRAVIDRWEELVPGV